jgi:hypothetical protein
MAKAPRPNTPHVKPIDPNDPVRNTSIAGLSKVDINRAAAETGRLNNAGSSTVPSYGGRANNPGQSHRADGK